MKYALTHQSAAQLFLTQAPSTIQIKPTKRTLDPIPPKVPDDLSSLSSAPIGTLSKPMHLIVANRATRPRLDNFHFHASSKPLPPKSFVQIEEDLYSVCPELCFAQMSSSFSQIELIKFGIELCGTYVPKAYDSEDFTFSTSCIVKREPLTSVKRLHRLAPSFGVGNTRVISTALRWIVDGSASPRETALYLLLCLPYRFGGYGLPKPVMNYEIPLSAKESRMANHGLFRADLFWPEQCLDVEYDSTQYHANETRMEADAVRRNVLNHKGIRVLSVTRNQMNNALAFDGVARQIGKALGKRIQPRQGTFYERRKALRKLLINRWD